MGAFRLAFYLGKTVSEISEISWDEFIYWNAYLRSEPPEEGANYRNAALMAQITNMSGRSLRNNKTVSADDFLGKKKRQSIQEQIAFFKSMGKGA